MGMKVWIVTIGNSDVQLKSGYKKSLWNNHYLKFEKEYKHTFEPARETPKDPATVPARVMGIVYGTNLDNQIFQELHFPLLDKFTEYLQGTNRPDKIIVILTNQENVFDNKEKNNKQCPYWQDTCTLQTILEKYFEQDKKYPELKTGEHIHYLPLEAQPEKEGLDDWNECLELVDKLFQKKEITSIDKDANIFVSHQAGTPAISSAVQFTSLAKFEKQVKFLVSNEYNQKEADYIDSSTYLQGIKLQEAKKLLNRYDYSGVEKIFNDICNNESSNNEKVDHIKKLLKIAIQWNSAKFEDFGKSMIKIDTNYQQYIDKTWWWMGYEAAYLAVIRLEQGNNVEALFHSFRAIEGTLYKWVQQYYHQHIIKVKKYGEIKVEIKKSILDIITLQNYYEQELEKKGSKGLYGDFLYDIFKASRKDSQKNPHICQKVWNYLRNERNNLFHQLLGLAKEEVFQAWNTDDEMQWKERVLGCLNFIAKQEFNSLEEASLMSSVHKELTEAINKYELQTPS